VDGLRMTTLQLHILLFIMHLISHLSILSAWVSNKKYLVIMQPESLINFLPVASLEMQSVTRTKKE